MLVNCCPGTRSGCRRTSSTTHLRHPSPSSPGTQAPSFPLQCSSRGSPACRLRETPTFWKQPIPKLLGQDGEGWSTWGCSPPGAFICRDFWLQSNNGSSPAWGSWGLCLTRAGCFEALSRALEFCRTSGRQLQGKQGGPRAGSLHLASEWGLSSPRQQTEPQTSGAFYIYDHYASNSHSLEKKN